MTPMRGRSAAASRTGSSPSTRTVPAIGRAVALEDLDRRRLARAVRSEQPEHLAAARRRTTRPSTARIVAVVLREPGDGDGRVGGSGGHGERFYECGHGAAIGPARRRRRRARRARRARSSASGGARRARRAPRRRAVRSRPRSRRARRCARTRPAARATSSPDEIGGAEAREQLAVGGVGARERERDQRRGLALAQIVADRLAGDLGVAERAEHVVAQLERLPERQPDRRQRRTEFVEPAGERGAEVQRSLDRVLARLVDVAMRCASAASVLADAVPTRSSDWPTHNSTRSSSKIDVRGIGHAAHQHVGVDEREVADEDRHAFAEPARLAAPRRARRAARANCAVHRVVAAPRVGAVHDVVVHERERVHELERGRGVDDARIVGVAARADERAVTERGPQPLAARRRRTPRSASMRFGERGRRPRASGRARRSRRSSMRRLDPGRRTGSSAAGNVASCGPIVRHARTATSRAGRRRSDTRAAYAAARAGVPVRRVAARARRGRVRDATRRLARSRRS